MLELCVTTSGGAFLAVSVSVSVSTLCKVSAFWRWLVPPDGAAHWNCTWSARERSFSNGVIGLWASLAGSRGRAPPAGGAWPAQAEASGARINLKIGDTKVLRGFRKPFCSWWATVYTRIRKAQGNPA